MNIEILTAYCATVEELFGDVGIAGGGQQRREHIDMADDAVQDRACLDLARPPHEAWHTPSALPVGVLLAPERCVCTVGPSVVLRSVVGGVHDDSVIGDAQFFELVEYHPDLLVVDDHAIAIRVLSALAEVLFCDMGPKVHSRRVIPKEKRLLRLGLRLHPS